MAQMLLSTLQTIVVGLTGSMGMGKTTISAHFRRLGFAVFDADAAVHALRRRRRGRRPDRRALPVRHRRRRGQPPRALRPRSPPTATACCASSRASCTRSSRPSARRSCARAHGAREWLVVADVPLLLEQAQARGELGRARGRRAAAAAGVDAVVVVSCSEAEQTRRCLARDGMTRRSSPRSARARCPTRASARSPTSSSTRTTPPRRPGARRRAVIEQLEERAPAAARAGATPCRRAPRISSSTAAARGAGRAGRARRRRRRRRAARARASRSTSTTRSGRSCRRCAQAAAVLAAELAPRTRARVRGGRGRRRPAHGEGRHGRRARASRCSRTTSPSSAASRSPRSPRARGDDAAAVDAVMARFVAARSDVAEHLYDDALPCLARLRARGVRVGALRNGNADVFACAAPRAALRLRDRRGRRGRGEAARAHPRGGRGRRAAARDGARRRLARRRRRRRAPRRHARGAPEARRRRGRRGARPRRAGAARDGELAMILGAAWTSGAPPRRRHGRRPGPGRERREVIQGGLHFCTPKVLKTGPLECRGPALSKPMSAGVFRRSDCRTMDDASAHAAAGAFRGPAGASHAAPAAARRVARGATAKSTALRRGSRRKNSSGRSPRPSGCCSNCRTSSRARRRSSTARRAPGRTTPRCWCVQGARAAASRPRLGAARRLTRVAARARAPLVGGQGGHEEHEQSLRREPRRAGGGRRAHSLEERSPSSGAIARARARLEWVGRSEEPARYPRRRSACTTCCRASCRSTCAASTRRYHADAVIRGGAKPPRPRVAVAAGRARGGPSPRARPLSKEQIRDRTLDAMIGHVREGNDHASRSPSRPRASRAGARASSPGRNGA